MNNQKKGPVFQPNEFWLDKPYYSFNAYCRHTFGAKTHKISLDAGLTCPNRDGRIGTRGCIFCSQGGSGDFALSIGTPNTPMTEAQIHSILTQAMSSEPDAFYIGYFQAYTNTYGPVDYLRGIYTAVLSHPGIKGISIGTRPDCMDSSVMALLQELQEQYPAKFIWIELGLQTMHDTTATYIRRGYPLDCFTRCANQLKDLGIPFVVHLILGLPGESDTDLTETINYVNQIHPFGIKLQLLHVLEYTDLATDYEDGLFQTLELDSYIQLLSDCIAHLSPDIVICRVTGDGPKDITISPKWSFNKKNVLNTLHKYLRMHNIYQGCMLN